MWILIASGGAALLSLFAELGLGLVPCFLCLVQRGLHLATFAASRFRTLCLLLLSLSLLVSTYHALIQFGWIQDRCRTAHITDLASYRAALTASPPCKEAWTIANVPASVLNALLSGLLLFTQFKRKQS